MENHKVIVYSTPTCPFCVLAKNHFKAKGVDFEDVDVSQDTIRAVEMVQKTGQMGVPVVDIDGKIVVGYQPQIFDSLLA